MVRLLRAAAVLFSAAMWGLYVRAAVTSDAMNAAQGWANGWMGPAITSVGVVVVVFVLTLRRAGTRGSVLTNLADMAKRTRIKQPVEGTAQVVSASAPPHSGQNAGRAMCVMNLVVTVPGQPSVAVDTAALVPLAKWPSPGTSLPVLADQSDPRQFKILWDNVATGWDTGTSMAQQLADQMNAAGSTSATSATGGPIVLNAAMINGKPASADDLAPFEAMTGMDLNGDGRIGDNPAGPTTGTSPRVVAVSGHDAQALLNRFLGGTPGQGFTGAGEPGAADHSADPVDRLERLSALRSTGAITDAEYEAAKRKVLGR